MFWKFSPDSSGVSLIFCQVYNPFERQDIPHRYIHIQYRFRRHQSILPPQHS